VSNDFANSGGPVAASNADLVRDLIVRFFNDHNPDVASHYFAPNFTWHGGSVGDVEGRDAYADGMRRFWAALPDVRATEQDVVAGGDKVAMRFVVEGTHQGDLWGIPAQGKRVRWDAIMIYHFAEGKIVEQWASEDWAAILQTVGSYTPPFAAEEA
jgi:steroid delta-isomerase-like uncharacterized protein